jgi:uncharacterized protein YkwD
VRHVRAVTRGGLARCGHYQPLPLHAGITGSLCGMSAAPALPLRPDRATACSVAVLLLLLLGACGGGDDGGDAAPGDPAQAATGEGMQSPATPGAPAVAAQASCGIADFAASALARINQRRAAGATCGSQGSFASAAPLRWNALLAQASAAHSADMAAMNYFSHTSLDGRSMSERVNATGYAWASLGENIAAGYPDLDSVIDGWMRSDGHCANLMNPAFDEVGLACVPAAPGSRYAQYWTQNLARAR